MTLKTIVVVWALALLPTLAIQGADPIEAYRKLEFPPKDENFDKGWQDRVALEFAVVNTADLPALRAALRDTNLFVRAIAARTLGIRGDKASAEALATLAASDPEYPVRIRAIESLAWLKEKPEVIERALKDSHVGVAWAAQLLAGQAESVTDHAAQVREAYAVGIRREEMGSAKVGQPAPDFVARTTDGNPFRLSSVLGKKPIAIYFSAFDG